MKSIHVPLAYAESNAIEFGNWLKEYQPKDGYNIPMEGLYRMFSDEKRAKLLATRSAKKNRRKYSPQMKEKGRQVKAAIQLYCMENDIDLSPLQDFHLRLSKDDCETLDIYPISGKWHNVSTGIRGQIDLEEIENLINKHFNP